MATKCLNAAEGLGNRVTVLRTYRQLLRATYIAFKGDQGTLLASRRFARESFENSRRLESGTIEAGEALQHAQGVITILRQNVVQGTNVGGDKWKLNIHEHTERGDNATAKKMQGSVKSFKEIKESQF